MSYSDNSSVRSVSRTRSHSGLHSIGRDFQSWPDGRSHHFHRSNRLRQFRVKPVFEMASRVASCDGICRNIPRHNGLRRDNCAIANPHAGENDTVSSNPDIVPDDDVSLSWQFIQVRRCASLPCAAKDMKGVGAHTADDFLSLNDPEATARRFLISRIDMPHSPSEKSIIVQQRDG